MPLFQNLFLIGDVMELLWDSRGPSPTSPPYLLDLRESHSSIFLDYFMILRWILDRSIPSCSNPEQSLPDQLLGLRSGGRGVHQVHPHVGQHF